ncbi:Gfo/Idh/MocA family oxidoreductase [Brenneria populi subsp. brevivirga]|uniref:Gfo/Idh/MocA family protein n=1 Tax=Brenneria populi TaxID=1505588 RepID=UPI002E1995A0|nr:Gfo/Idh/MocA family oxidoreductase [Brenneria populi subsp. brevivirga]
MKLGILGTGMIVRDLLTTIHKLHLESLAILGTEQTRDETLELAAANNIESVFFDYETMLESDVDTIYIALPNHLHFSFASQALSKGKHVIIEKPITSNTRELNELKSLAEEKQLIILEAMNIHYLPAYLSLKENIATLGNLKLVTLNYSQYSSRYDSFMSGVIHPAFDYRKTGGALMDINVYNIHFVVGLFGRPLTVNYYANIQRKIDTSGVMILDYGSLTCVCIGAKDCRAPTTSVLQGDKASAHIHIPVNQMQGYDIVLNDGNSENFNFDDRRHRLLHEFQEFIRIIDSRDYLSAQQMLEISSIVAEVMETGRKQQHVEFTNDR